MHRCLQILETIDSVCDYLDPAIGAQPYPAGRLRDLAMLSRTCTLFEGPAQDHVWRKTGLGTLLVACMPSDLWAVDSHASWPWHKKMVTEIDIQRLRRPIREADWNRIQFHAPRVRELSLRASGISVLDILSALSVSLPKLRFTNLQRLGWTSSGVEGFHYIRLFIRPTLDSLSFNLTSDSEASLLPTLPTKCPNLTKLGISSGYRSRCTSELVMALQNPHTITVPSLDWDALEHLSRQPTLKILNLEDLPTAPTAPLLLGTARFPALHTLSLLDPGILPTARFLDFCRATPLSTFTASFYDLVTPAQMHALFVALAAGVRHDSLTVLTIENECRNNSNAYAPSPATVRG
ncbi:hypothetical protein C8R46DRAFT_985059 [Mycena filopes]|nr:hypothetical protein C8R46DRAFT_985059 [Mycena filopes]